MNDLNNKIYSINPNYLLLIATGLLCIDYLLGNMGGMLGDILKGFLGISGFIIGIAGILRSIEIWFWKTSKYNRIANKIINIISIAALILTWDILAKSYNQVKTRPSKQQIITESVKLTKKREIFPKQIDDVTTWVDVIERPNGVRFQFILSNVDTSKLTTTDFKDFIIENECKNTSTTDILEKGIYVEYEYTVKETNEKFLVTLSDTDCSL